VVFFFHSVDSPEVADNGPTSAFDRSPSVCGRQTDSDVGCIGKPTVLVSSRDSFTTCIIRFYDLAWATFWGAYCALLQRFKFCRTSILLASYRAILTKWQAMCAPNRRYHEIEVFRCVMVWVPSSCKRSHHYNHFPSKSLFSYHQSGSAV
jgi:hypothetical protein